MSIRHIVVIISFLIISTTIILPSMSTSIRAEETKITNRSSHIMTLQDAASLTKLYRINTESTAMLVQYFGKDAVDKALTQPGCVQVRVYYGKGQEGKSGYLIYGVDKKGNEMIASLIPVCPACPRSKV
jgi:hypothetical protein